MARLARCEESRRESILTTNHRDPQPHAAGRERTVRPGAARGEFRVFEVLIEDEPGIVKIKAVGHEEHGVLHIGDKEVPLDGDRIDRDSFPMIGSSTHSGSSRPTAAM